VGRFRRSLEGFGEGAVGRLPVKLCMAPQARWAATEIGAGAWGESWEGFAADAEAAHR